MPVLTVVLVLIALGVMVALSAMIPDKYLDPTFKQIIKWVAIVGFVLWICSLFGLFQHLSAIRIGK
jgi:hypothetical protein